MRIGLSSDLGSFSLSFLDNLDLNELGLSNDLIVLEVSLCVDLTDVGVSISHLLTSQSLDLGLDSFNLFLFVQLSQRSLLFLVLSLFSMDDSGFFFLFRIIFDSLVVSESFSLKGSLELINGGILHCVGYFSVQSHTGDHDSLDENSLVLEIGVQELLHALGMSVTSQVVCVLGLDGSGHGPNSLHDIGVDQLVLLGHVSHELLHVVGVVSDLQKNGHADIHVSVIQGVHPVVWALVNEILSGD